MKTTVIATLCVAVLAGCNSLGDVKDELGKGGFALWYPAEGGVEPGQIWQVEGNSNRRIRQQNKPAELKIDKPVNAQFETLKKTVDATSSLDLSFTNQILGKAGDMAALLKEGSVKSVDLNFGDTDIQRMTLGDLRDPSIRSKLSAGYLEDLDKVNADNRDYVVIAAVVRASGMKYVFKCEDTAQLEARAPKIAQKVSADFKLSIVSKTEAVWEIPNTTPLVIGILPVFGKDLGFSQEEISRRLQAKMKTSDEIMKSIKGSARIRFDDLR